MKKRDKYEIIDFMHKGKPRLFEINPDIEQVNVLLDFKNDENIHISIQREIRPQDSSVFFTDCINLSCTKGFFDLTNDIFYLLRDRKAVSKGVIKCDGWQDEERKNNHKCLTTLEFEIVAKYKI
jgi:hypothetical protein